MKQSNTERFLSFCNSQHSCKGCAVGLGFAKCNSLLYNEKELVKVVANESVASKAFVAKCGGVA